MRGPTRLSLVDTRAGRIVHTLKIADGDVDSFDVPYTLGSGGPYRVSGRFGRPSILRLADYTGDGVAAELALFDALSCSTLLTTLIGYNGHDDRLVQFPIHTRFESYDAGSARQRRLSTK